MTNLLYKEFKLTINPFFYILPFLTGALMLIPTWLYFFVLLYFCFITVPNFFANSKAQNDVSFSVLMPVRKSDIVKARILSVISLELLHMVTAVIYAVIHNKIYKMENFFLNPNIAFFGISFMMFALFNVILFPMFYKNAYQYGAAVGVSTGAAFVFTSCVELLVVFSPGVQSVLEGNTVSQLLVLAAGIVSFILTAYIAYRLSSQRFEKVDI
ncbi:MAG: ABC-2 transporter permease [Clostridia bacterium]|nr:ABC-2 transporter permease [Clostridia bacterium]